MDVKVARELGSFSAAALPDSECGFYLMVQSGCLKPAVTPPGRPAGRRKGQEGPPPLAAPRTLLAAVHNLSHPGGRPRSSRTREMVCPRLTRELPWEGRVEARPLERQTAGLPGPEGKIHLNDVSAPNQTLTLRAAPGRGDWRPFKWVE